MVLQRAPERFAGRLQGETMSIDRLDHVSIRNLVVEAPHAFYADVLCLAKGWRPDFPFPGVWL